MENFDDMQKENDKLKEKIQIMLNIQPFERLL
jgi:hypothetical protein